MDAYEGLNVLAATVFAAGILLASSPVVIVSLVIAVLAGIGKAATILG